MTTDQTNPTLIAVYRAIAVDSSTAFSLHHSYASNGLSAIALADFGAELKWKQVLIENEKDAIFYIADVSALCSYEFDAKTIYSVVTSDVDPIALGLMPSETIQHFVSQWPLRTQQVAAVVMPKLKDAGFTIQRAFVASAVGEKQWGRFVAVRGNDVVDVLLADF